MKFRLPIFQIPDFPRGALLVTTLFAIALLGAFPDAPYSWILGIVIAAGVIAWVLGSGWILWPKPEAVSQPREPAAKQYWPNRPSADFAALINAITTQGQENRKEEKREDRSKKFREWLTIILLIGTVVLLRSQVTEMQKVYGPISDQAQAVKDNMVADHRAWIGVVNITADSFIIGNPVVVHVGYNNTGRQPAPIVQDIRIGYTTPKEWGATVKTTRINTWHDKCFSVADIGTAVITAFPTQGSSFYTDTKTSAEQADNSAFVVDDDIAAGRKIIVVFGCFLYKSFDIVRHTSFCSANWDGTAVTRAFTFCSAGNDAN